MNSWRGLILEQNWSNSLFLFADYLVSADLPKSAFTIMITFVKKQKKWITVNSHEKSVIFSSFLFWIFSGYKKWYKKLYIFKSNKKVFIKIDKLQGNWKFLSIVLWFNYILLKNNKLMMRIEAWNVKLA